MKSYLNMKTTCESVIISLSSLLLKYPPHANHNYQPNDVMNLNIKTYAMVSIKNVTTLSQKCAQSILFR